MMNKMRKLGLVVATAAAFAASTASADEYNWSGFYGGALVGATEFKTDTLDPGEMYTDVDQDAPAYSEVEANGGLTAGYNWQLSKNFVVGIEADISSGAKSSETTDDAGDAKWESEWNWLATVRARAGLAVDRTLVYVTGGVAIADAEYNVVGEEGTDEHAPWDGKLTGLVAGAGVEHALTENMSFKTEYLYVSMPKKDACWITGDPGACRDDEVHWDSSGSLVRVGLNWKF